MASVALISLYDEFCIGIRFIGSFLKQNGHEVTLIHFKRYARRVVDGRVRAEGDQSVDSYITAIYPWGDEILNYAVPYSEKEIALLFGLLAERKVSIVGISVPSFHKKTALELSKLIQSRLGLPVVWGGIHPTIAPDDCFDDEGIVNYVCLFEGEYTFQEFIEAFERHADFTTTPLLGMWIRLNGKIIRNEPRPVEMDLDKLGPMMFDEELEFTIDENRLIHKELAPDNELAFKYKTITGRGCPFACSYCINSTLNRRYKDSKRLRHRSPQHVIAELVLAKKRLPHLKRIEFYDDVFVAQRDWLLEFAELYKKEVAVPFWCFAHPLMVKRETLAILKDMEIQYINMGIQSGSDRINFEVYGRRTPREKILEAARLIAEFKMLALYDVLCANPYETEEDLYDTLELLTRFPEPFYLQVGELGLFPSTPMTERVEREKKVAVVDAKRRRFWNALYLLSQFQIVGRETLMGLTQDQYLRDNPQILWDWLKLAATSREESYQKTVAEQTVKVLEERLKAVEMESTALKARRAVRYSVKLADSVRRLASSFRRHDAPTGLHS